MKVRVAVVVERDPKLTTRRLAYYHLEKGAIPTDIGWVLLSPAVEERLMEVDRRHRMLYGRSLVRVYEVEVKPETLAALIESSLEEGLVPEPVRRWAERMVEELRAGVRA